jgi:SAM-dependent methyltransferase
MNPSDLEVLEALQKEYERQGGGESGFLNFASILTGSQYIKLYQLCRKYFTSDFRILDWGAGNGHFSYYLLSQGYRAVGYSFIDFTFKHLINDLDYTFIQGFSENPIELPFPDESFNAVASIGVLEHVRETGGSEEASLKEITRILKPGGYFLCYHLPNRYSWVEALARFLNYHHHQYYFTHEEIEDFCDKAELDLIEINRYAFLPRQLLARKVPKNIRQSSKLATVYNQLDTILEFIFNRLNQNYYFIASKSLA